MNSREAFERVFSNSCVDLSKDETGEYSSQPTRMCYSFFVVGWQEQQKRIDEQAKEINFLNNRADDLALDQMKTAQFNYQLEQKINDLQAQLDEVNASNLRRSVHIDRLQKHNLKLQQRLKENGLEWKDLIEEQALKGGEV